MHFFARNSVNPFWEINTGCSFWTHPETFMSVLDSIPKTVVIILVGKAFNEKAGIDLCQSYNKEVWSKTASIWITSKPTISIGYRSELV